MDPAFIVLLSFVAFMGIAWRLGYQKALQALDEKIASISNALAHATLEKENILEKLNEERRRREDQKIEIAHILKGAEEQVFDLRRKTLQEIDRLVKKRRQETDSMMHRLHSEALHNLQDEIIANAIQAIETLVASQFSETRHEALNDRAINQILAQFDKGTAEGLAAIKPVRKKRIGRV